MFSVARLFAPIPAFALVACLFSQSGDAGGNGPVGPAGDLIFSRAYNVSGSSIIASIPPDTSRDCYTGTLRIQPRPARSDTTGFEIRQDSLILESDSGQYDSALTFSYFVWRREGTGSGLTGLWRWIAVDRRILKGPVTAKDAAYFAKQKAYQDTIFKEMKVMLLIDGETISWYSDDHAARQSILAWNLVGLTDSVSKASKYAVALSEADKRTVRMHGEKTGENVWISQFQSDSTAYRSDKPGNAPLTYRNNPRSCPNPHVPEWYEDFLTANKKP